MILFNNIRIAEHIESSDIKKFVTAVRAEAVVGIGIFSFITETVILFLWIRLFWFLHKKEFREKAHCNNGVIVITNNNTANKKGIIALKGLPLNVNLENNLVIFVF